MNIINQHIMITGANRGIGLAVAKMCAKQKTHLHLVLRKNQPELKQQLLELGALTVQIWTADLANKSDVKKLAEDISKIEIDILINNAGVLTGGLIENQTIDEIYSLFQVNVLSLIQLTKAVVPGMVQRKKGKIINNASVSALMHFPCATTYAASKAAVMAFNNCLEAELKNTGVSTLCLITPGIKTRMFEEINVKYSQNFKTPEDSITPESFAELIKNAILNDDPYLNPKGSTAIGLFINKYLPALFRFEVQRRFKR